MTTELYLEFPDTGNVKTFRVTDGSNYNHKIKVECPILEITPPGYSSAVSFNVVQGFSTVLNSSNLNISKVKAYSKLQPLPDGVYKIKYSIKPNESLWIEYNYLRINKFVKDYNTELCALKLQACEPDNEVKLQLKKLREIDTYIKAAKIEVEDCGNIIRGLELYEYATKLLNKFQSSNCVTCK